MGIFIDYKRLSVRKKKLNKLSEQAPLVSGHFIKALY